MTMRRRPPIKVLLFAPAKRTQEGSRSYVNQRKIYSSAGRAKFLSQAADLTFYTPVINEGVLSSAALRHMVSDGTNTPEVEK